MVFFDISEVELGVSCPQMDACATENATCNNESICVCSYGFYDSNSDQTNGGTCVPSKEIFYKILKS